MAHILYVIEPTTLRQVQKNQLVTSCIKKPQRWKTHKLKKHKHEIFKTDKMYLPVHAILQTIV